MPNILDGLGLEGSVLIRARAYEVEIHGIPFFAYFCGRRCLCNADIREDTCRKDYSS